MSALHFDADIDIKKVEQKVKNLNDDLGKIGKQAANQGSIMDNAFGKVGNTLEQVGINLPNLIGPAAGLAAAFKFKQLADEALAFENAFGMAMREVQTISGAVQGDFEGISKSIVDMAANGPDDAIKLAKAYYQIVSAGHDGAAGLELLAISSKAAVAGVTDTMTAADGLTTVINAWGIGADKANMVADVMFKTVERGKTTFSQLASNIAQVAPLASANNIEFEQIFAALQTITKQGTPTAQAMTQIRSSIINMNNALGDGWSKAMTYQDGLNKISEMAGGSQVELKKLIPDVEGMSAVLALTGEKAKGAAEDLNETAKASGAMGTAYGRMMNEADNKWSIVHNKWTREMRELGKSMKEGSSMFADFLNDLLTNEKADIIDPASKKIVDDTAASISNLATKEEKLTAVIAKINELKGKRINELNPTVSGLEKQQPGWLTRGLESFNAGIGLGTAFSPGRVKQAELSMYNKELAITQQAEKELFKLYTDIASTKDKKGDDSVKKARTLKDINDEITAAKALQDASSNKTEFNSIQKTIEKLEAEKIAITGLDAKAKQVTGEYNKLGEAINKASDAVLNASEKERPALQEKLRLLISQREEFEAILKAQRSETVGMKPITPQGATVASKIVDTKTLGTMKQLTKEERTQLEIKADKISKDAVAEENFEKQIDLINQMSGALGDVTSEFAEQLGLSEDQAVALQDGMKAIGGIAKIASGNYIGGAVDLLSSVGKYLINAPEKLSVHFEHFNEQIQKVITSLDLAGVTFSNLNKDATGSSLKVIKAEMLDLADVAKSLNTELSSSSTGRRRDTNMNLPNIVKQASEINKEIEALTNRLLKGDISDEQRKSIEAVLESYNSLLTKIDSMIQDLTGTTVTDLSRSISDAILDGADAWDVWGQKANDVIKNVISKQLTSKLLNTPITDAVNALVNDSTDGLSSDEAKKFKDSIKSIYESVGPAYQTAMDSLNAVGIDLGSKAAASNTPMTGISASATEDTVSAMVGQAMAIRVDLKINQEIARNQLELMDQCFMVQTQIEKNTRGISRLENVENRLNDINDTLKKGLL